MSFFSPEAVAKRSQATKTNLDVAARYKKAQPKKVQEETQAAISDMIGLVANKNFSDASSLVTDLLNQRVSGALDDYKQQLAQSLFTPAVELTEEKDEDDEDEDKDEKDEKDEDKKDEDEKDEEKKKLDESEQLDERAKYDYDRVRVHPSKRSKYQRIYGANWFGRYLKDNPKEKEKVRIKEESEQLDEVMTRKHFQQVADTLKAIPDMKKRTELAQHHATVFKQSNPRFDHSRFYAAAGVTAPKE